MKDVSTTTFRIGPETHQEDPGYEGGKFTGMIVGFSCLAIFIVVAAFLIIRDEINRHKNYEKLIERDIRKLRDQCGQTPEQMEHIMNDFEESEAKRGQNKDDEKARQELADIN